MSNKTFIRFFDKLGNDMGLSSVDNTITSLYTGLTSTYESFTGKLFFPKVSLGLIESQQLYLLQEVTGPSSKYELRKVPGSVEVISGNNNINGIDADFSVIKAGNVVKVGNYDYTVTSVNSTSFVVSPTPYVTYSTSNIYYYDYVSLSELRSAPNTFSNTISAFIDDEYQTEYFLYDVNYSDEFPLIERSFSSTYDILNGSSDAVDTLTGRIHLTSVVTTPLQINLGFSSGATATFEDIYEYPLVLENNEEYIKPLISWTTSGSYSTLVIDGTANPLYDISRFFIQGATASGSTSTFYDNEIEIIGVGITGSNTYIDFKTVSLPSFINSYSLSNFRLYWKNVKKLATIDLYGETEEEDERFKSVLENFGKKLDFDSEYIFRDSDIDEDLPDYNLLNKKRKELLLEGDNIYPYLGSYRALVNIVNFFGYYDLTIKEYFLNVDANSVNYNKYLHILVPKTDDQRKEIRKAWELVPSNIYKKTALFGLFYDLNRTTTETDTYGIPIVEDAFDFSPEEVLIKLFGLKELLKKQFLPLNARIYDITGEGIYFQRIRVDSWSDNLNHLVLNLGKKPEYTIYPSTYTVLSDIRRIDQYYIDKFIEQGLTGFANNITPSPYTANTSPVINQLYPYNLYSYANYSENPYTSSPDLTLPIIDDSWLSMPPGISNPFFNDISARMEPLPDDEGILTGGIILLEALFNLTWEESDFTWLSLGIIGPSGSPINVNHWSWESIGRGEYIDMRWVIEKQGHYGFFYDSGRRSINEFAVAATGDSTVGTYRYLHAAALPYEGNYEIALYTYDVTNNFSVDYQKYEVKSKNIDFVSIHRKETTERIWQDFASTISWSDMTGPWYYPLHVKSNWEDAQTSWESLNFSSYEGTELFEYQFDTEILSIDRFNSTVTLRGDLTSPLTSGSVLNTGDYLFFSRNEAEPIVSNQPVSFYNKVQGLLGSNGMDAIVSGNIGSSFINTGLYNCVDFTSIGSQVYFGNFWYTITNVDPTSIYVTPNLIESAIDVVLPLYDELVSMSNQTSMGYYSRVLVTELPDYTLINPQVDFYRYVDGTDFHTIATVNTEEIIKEIIVKNTTTNMYCTWGIFGGTSAIQISNIYLDTFHDPFSGDMIPVTRFKLNDSDKEIWKIDSNFTVRLADYDVDYAENRIGSNSLTYQNLDEIKWDDNKTITWNGTEYHGGSLCGFVIPFVSPGGTITIDENESFEFSGDYLIDSSKDGLTLAASELNASINEGISKFNYIVLPDDTIYLTDLSGSPIELDSDAFIGDDTLYLDSIPNHILRIPAKLSFTILNGVIDTVNIDNPGWGYTHIPNITISMPGGTGTQAIITCSVTDLPENGKLDSINIIYSGSGYDPDTVTIIVEPPYDYKPEDETIWTGYEWVRVERVDSSTNLVLSQTLNYPITAGSNILLPYQYHKQLFGNPDVFQQFYYFIHAKAVNPSNELLSYINFDNGVESEWLDYPNRSYSYPLRNSFYFLSVPEYSDLSQDVLYNTWVYEGSDYPPLEIPVEYSSDVLSYESRIPYAQTTQSTYSFIDTIISNSQEFVDKFTPVVFSYDKCKIPGKINPLWTIKNDNDGTIEMMTTKKKFIWNFTKSGSYSVLLKIEDANGNVTSGQKNSFIIV